MSFPEIDEKGGKKKQYSYYSVTKKGGKKSRICLWQQVWWKELRRMERGKSRWSERVSDRHCKRRFSNWWSVELGFSRDSNKQTYLPFCVELKQHITKIPLPLGWQTSDIHQILFRRWSRAWLLIGILVNDHCCSIWRMEWIRWYIRRRSAATG